MNREHSREYLCGFAAALAAMQRLCGLGCIVGDAMQSAGVTLDDLRRAEAHGFDLYEIGVALGLDKEGKAA